MRPIVLNGDDLTLICRADLALEFVKAFLDEFERATGRDVEHTPTTPECAQTLSQILQQGNVFARGKNYLSACAGIAYIKSSYPFYYGYRLAETLCADAKKESKALSGGMTQLPPSSVAFHKVQSSFVEDFAEIERKELTMGDVSLNFGPDYLNSKDVQQLSEAGSVVWQGNRRWSIPYLQSCVAKLEATDAGHALKSNLRDWLTVLSIRSGAAGQRAQRIVSQVTDESLQKWVAPLFGWKRTPIYDLLSLYSIQNADTFNPTSTHESR
jgi:hypothetical protein